MAITYSPSIPTNGLVYYVDARNRKSNIRAAGNTDSLITTDSWTVGTGAVTGYPVNGLASESQRLYDTDPWGKTSLVWGSYPSGDNGADGGWEGTTFNIDNTKKYRYCVWVRRSSSTASGSFYFGLHTNGSGDTYHLSDGASQTNPYWSSTGIGNLVQNQWYLYVGHIFPAGYSGTTPDPASGVYTIQSGRIGGNNSNVANDVKFPSNATQAMQRVYHYYCADTTSRLQFAYPRVDLIDGSEPTVGEILNRSPAVLYDMSKAGLHTTLARALKRSTLESASGATVGTTATTSVLSNDYHSIFLMVRFNTTGTYGSNGYSGSYDKIFTYPANGDRAPGVWRYPSNRFLHWRYNPSNTGADFGATGTVAGANDFAIDTWYYVGVVKNGATATMYVNGTQVGTATVASPSSVGTAPIYLFEGHALDGLTSMGACQAWNRVLTAAEVQANFNVIRRRYGI